MIEILSAGLGVALLLLAAAFSTGLLAAASAAGRDIGHALVAETAPRSARMIVTLAAWISLRSVPKRIRERVMQDVSSLVSAEFDNRTSPVDRARGVLVIASQSWALVRAAREIVEAADRAALSSHPAPKVETQTSTVLVGQGTSTFLGSFFHTIDQIAVDLKGSLPRFRRQSEFFKSKPESLRDALNATGDWREWNRGDRGVDELRNEPPSDDEDTPSSW